MIHKYKIGDRVRTKPREEGCDIYPLPFLDEMLEEGKILTINSIEKGIGLYKNTKYYNGDNTVYLLSNRFWYHSSMLEPEVVDLESGEMLTLFGFKGYVNNTIPDAVFISFVNHYEAYDTIKQKVPTFNDLAVLHNGKNLDINFFPTFPSLHQLTLFVNALREIEQTNPTPQNKNQNENNEIRFQKPKASIERGIVPEGHQVCGKRSRTSIIVGHLSNRAWNL